MAEALSIAAGAAQFAGLALKIAKVGKGVYDQLQNAPEQIPKWLKEIDYLRTIVSNIADCPELHGDDVASMVQTCVSTSRELYRVLDGIHFSPKDPLPGRAWKAIVGKSKEDEICALFDAIERVKSNLELTIGIEQLNQIRNISSELNDLKASFGAGSEEKTCLQALFITNPIQDRQGIIDFKGDVCPGTCEWIISTEEFKTWELTSPHLLWISAPPGVGKTYMSIFLTRHLEHRNRRQPGHTIFFFCDNKNQSRNTATNILRGLIYQLIQYQPELINIILPQWKTQKSALFQGNSLNQLWGFFEEMVKRLETTPLYCIVDALDECEESSLSTLLRKFELLGTSNRFSTGKMKLICLSRRYPERIPESLLSFRKIELDMMPAGKADIQRFIAQRVLELAKKKNIINHPLQHHIETIFKKRSGDTFLWVSFMTRDLENKSINEIEAALGQLPHGLEAVYERILLSIETKNIDAVSNVLGWLLLASRPLRVPELCEAINIQPTPILSREEVCRSLVNSCGHLLQTPRYEEHLWPSDESSHTDETEEQTGQNVVDYWEFEVTFLHQSAKDYLIKTRNYGPEKRILSLRQSHESICDQLIGYLSTWLSDSDLKLSKSTGTIYPLANYAAHFWDVHFQKLSRVGQIIKRNKKFFEKDSKVRRLWEQAVEYRFHWYHLEDDAPSPLLHLACDLGIYNLAEWCVKKNTKMWIRNKIFLKYDLDKKWGIRGKMTPIFVATYKRHDSIFKLLFDAGADFETASDHFMQDTLLDIIARQGINELFFYFETTERGKRFLKWKKNDRRKALINAARSGATDICRSLIETYGWDVDFSQSDSTPLESALRRGQLELAQTFVSKWQANTSDHWNLVGAALADRVGDDEFFKAMKLVQDWKLDFNVTDFKGCNMLCYFTSIFWYGDSSFFLLAMKRILRVGINPGHRNNRGRLPIHCAVYEHAFPCIILNTDMVKMMLGDGHISINAVCDKGQTILHHFILHQYSLKYIHDYDYGHPYSYSRYLDGRLAALRQLLGLGINRYLKDKDGNIALDLMLPVLSPGGFDKELAKAYDWEQKYILQHKDEYMNTVQELKATLENYATVPINLARSTEEPGNC